MPLDDAQRAVVGLPLGSSGVVVGAPGSGKTTALIERVAALVAAGVRPDEILVLTPSRAAATQLRDRLALAVRVPTPGALARSVAAFAYQIVRAHAVHSGGEPPQLLTGPDEDQLINDLLAGDAEDELAGEVRWPPSLPAEVRGTRGFRAELRAFLSECTTLGIEPDALSRLAKEREVPAWEAVASFAREYYAVRARLRGAHRDAAGLVREALGLVRTLSDQALGLAALLRLKVLMVDDAQELTLGGVELLEACRARGVAVLAFGDPDVGSGAFRGRRRRTSRGSPRRCPCTCSTGRTAEPRCSARSSPRSRHTSAPSASSRTAAPRAECHRVIPCARAWLALPVKSTT
jgi:Superfamily I DNA and RNA helicases